MSAHMVLFLNEGTETGKAVSSKGVRVNFYCNTRMYVACITPICIIHVRDVLELAEV